jgi:hypothetical protein
LISSVNNSIADLDSYQSNVLGIENYFLMKFLEPSIYDIPTVESNSPICIGNELKLIASGGTNYLWTGQMDSPLHYKSNNPNAGFK